MSNQLLLRRRDMVKVVRPDYLKFTALEDGCTLALNKVGNPTDHPTEYSLNKGVFMPYVFGTTLTFNEGDTIEWRRAGGYESDAFQKDHNNRYSFGVTGKFNIDGYITSLLSKEVFVTTIGRYAFNNLFTNTIEGTCILEIPDSVTTINNNALSSIPIFTDIILGEGLTYIDSSNFNWPINSLTIKNPVFTCNLNAGIYNPFNGNTKDVYYNGTLEQWLSLQDGFRVGDSLYNLHIAEERALNDIPTTIGNKIRDKAFRCVGNFPANLIVPNNIETIGIEAFLNSTVNGNITLPNVKVIGNGAFARTQYIYPGATFNLDFGSSLKTIGNQAFYIKYCPNKPIVFPSTFESSGSGAFYQMNSNSCTIILATTPPTISSNLSIPGIVADKKVYVPYSADHSILNAYKTANVWSTFENLIYELDENGEIPT